MTLQRADGPPLRAAAAGAAEDCGDGRDRSSGVDVPPKLDLGTASRGRAGPGLSAAGLAAAPEPQVPAARTRPSYAVASVDHALRLALLLQQEGPLRVTDAAERLDVSPSTAHRLLATLVYRDFAVQRPDRLYTAGPALRPAQASRAPVPLLRRVALPHLQALVDLVHETASVMVLAGTELRFLATVECRQVPRVGDREGRVVPAHLSAGGRALLAALPDDEVASLYSAADVDVVGLVRALALVRRIGFAVNDQETELGVTAVGRAVRGVDGAPLGALAVSMPTTRFRRQQLPAWSRALSAAAKEITADLAR